MGDVEGDDSAAPERSSSPSLRRRLPVLVVAASLSLLVLAISAAAVVVERRRNVTLTVPHRFINLDHGDYYRFEQRRSTINVRAAPGNHFGNLRVLFWERNATQSVDQQTCVTLPTPDGRAQPGLALRIDPGEGTTPKRSLIVTQNIWDGAIWKFWLLDVNGSGKSPAGDPIVSLDMYSSLFDRHFKLLPGPWRVCARAVGTDFSLKVWKLDTPEPSWKSPRVAHETLPSRWNVPGLPGAYVGHIKPGRHMTFNDLETQKLGSRP